MSGAGGCVCMHFTRRTRRRMLCAALALPAAWPLAWRSYNKREEDFGSKAEYDDYLEEVEDISAWGWGWG